MITDGMTRDEAWQVVLDRTAKNEGEFSKEEQRLICFLFGSYERGETFKRHNEFERCLDLSVAVINLAKSDYKKAIKRDMAAGICKEDLSDYYPIGAAVEIEEFFRSDLASLMVLGSVSGDYMIKFARKEAIAEFDKNKKVDSVRVGLTKPKSINAINNDGDVMEFGSIRTCAEYFDISEYWIKKLASTGKRALGWKFSYG